MGDLGWGPAREVAYRAAEPGLAVRVPLAEALGATLAEPLLAGTDLPPFDVSAMDGYAVRGAGPWRLAGRLLAGAAPGGELAPGTAVEIATGAPVPAGTAAVLPVEEAGLDGDRITGQVSAGRHVRARGEECRRGERLLEQGTPVTPVVLGLAAAAGQDTLNVRLRPRVRAAVTGDELLTDGVPRHGRIRDSLGPQLGGLVGAAGGDLVDYRRLGDGAEPLHDWLAASADTETLVVTGATSRGPADWVRPVLADLGGRLLVDGVACRPGHPQLLARLETGQLLVGLPGNPLAALAAAVTLLWPLLAARSGRALPPLDQVTLTEPAAATPGVTRLLPVTRDGELRRGAGPAMLLGAARSDGVAVIGPDSGGDLRVPFLAWPWQLRG